MSAARVLLAVAALAGLTACPTGENCFGGTSTTAEPPPQLAVAGQPVDVGVEAFIPLTCDGTEQFPDSLTSEVYAPGNRLVPSTTVLRGSSAGAVRFTPDVPGRYHVMAAFAPVGGIRQVGVLAAVDRSGEAPLLPLPEACAQLERTARGTLLCGAAVVREGQVAQRLGGAGVAPRMVAVAGDVAWAVDETNVYRYVDTGEALVLSGSVSHGGTRPEFLLATEDELLVLHETRLQRFISSAGALSSTGQSAWDEVQATVDSAARPRGFLVRSGDVLAVVGQGTLTQGGGFTVGTRACTYHLLQGRYVRTSEGACQELPGTPEGIEDGVLWTRETRAPTSGGVLPDQSVRRYVLAQGRFEEQGALLLGPALPTSSQLFRSTSVPVFILSQAPTPVVPTWRPEQHELVLEILDRSIFSTSASTTFYWGVTSSGLPRARVRTSPP